MKITQLQLDNFGPLASVDIRVEKPILLITGSNGAAKSFILDGTRMALSRQMPRGLTKKNQLGALINDQTGSKGGGVLVTCAGKDGEPNSHFGAVLPKGDFSGEELPEAMAVALDGQRFARMAPDERRSFLFRLTKRGAKAEDVRGRLLLAGCRPGLVDETLPMLHAGFEKAQEFAAGEAANAKRDWKAITATSYGPKLAENWAAPVPDLPAGDAAALHAEAAELDVQIAAQTEALGAIKLAAQQAAEAAQKRANLEAAAKRVPELERNLPLAVKERDDYQKLMETNRERAAGAKRGLVHDMARFIATTDIPSLGAEAEDAASALLQQYEKEHGSIAGNAEPAADVAAALPEQERALTHLINRATNLQRDLDAAKMAKGQYDALEGQEDAGNAAAALDEVQGRLSESKAQRQAVMNQALNIDAAIKNRGEALAKTNRAESLHDTIMAWLKIADQLAPSGIPAQILAAALQPVNDKLAQAADDSEWPLVRIGADMEITIERRAGKPLPYQMESVSYQWRADAHIAAVVAEISGLGLLMLDGADVLEPAARPGFFSWLDLLASEGIMESVVLAMTLKAPPTAVLDTFQVAWIDAGAAVGTEKRVAA